MSVFVCLFPTPDQTTNNRTLKFGTLTPLLRANLIFFCFKKIEALPVNIQVDYSQCSKCKKL